MLKRATATQRRASARGHVRATSRSAWRPHHRPPARAAAPGSTQLPGIWGGALSFKRGADHYFLLPDLQGHTRHMANAAGAVTHTFIYDAWGREIWPIVGTGVYLRPFGQWGYWRDTASRLYVRARHLRVELGRWVSRDPIGAPTDAYPYSRSATLAECDPSGRLSLKLKVLQCLDSCGNCEQAIVWQGLPARGKGWLIQHVSVVGLEFDCEGWPAPPTPGNEPTEFWEAWYVDNGQLWTDETKRRRGTGDTFSIAPRDPGSGGVAIRGYARYVPNYALVYVDQFGGIWNRATNQPPAWALPTTKKAPTLPDGSQWSDASANVRHALSTSWCCCPSSPPLFPGNSRVWADPGEAKNCPQYRAFQWP